MTTPTSPPPTQNVESLILQHMAAINRLCLKAFNTTDRDTLIFLILNDSIQAIRYDRAVLWGFSKDRKPKLLGVSGQTGVNKEAKLTKLWEAAAAAIKDPKNPQRMSANSFVEESAWNDYYTDTHANVVWIPIFSDDELVLGLWLEGFGQRFQEESVQDTLNFLSQYLAPAYGAAWKKFYKKPFLGGTKISKQQYAIIAAAVFLFLLLVRIPLRIVAPCEVVANDPFFMTAPLEGIVEKVDVEPGQLVSKGDILYEYDKRLPMRNLKASQKQVEILEEEVKRAKTLGLNDAKSLTELSILNLKLEKEKVNLGFVEWQATQLNQKASIAGVVMMENPDEWRGKPVKVGEKIMSINDPKNTKVKIWIPEDDNIILDPEKPIKVVLNIDPAHSYQARLEFVANESALSDLHIPSFLAEAKWIVPPEENKLGLKGTAIIYGQKVSLFYYLIRKPLGSVRHYFGI